jgi:Tfp pilus assembly protein PilN
MRAVNLLPRDQELQKAGPSKPVIAGCAGAVLAMVVLAGGYMQGSSALGKSNADLAAAQARLAAVPQPLQQPATVTGLPQERLARVTALSSALATRVAWDRVLREVSLVMPDDVWLTSLTGAIPSAAGVSPGQAVRIAGFTYSQASVARLLARLTVIPDIEHVSLDSSTQVEVGTRPVFQFEIGADLKTVAAAATVPDPTAAVVPAAPTS